MGDSSKTCQACLIAVAFTLSASSQMCTKEQYKSGAECLPCQGVCDNSESIEFSQCLAFCKGHRLKRKQCNKGYYYDVNLSRCDTCKSICDKHESMGTSADCKMHCPEEFAKSTTNPAECLEGSYYDKHYDKCINCLKACNDQKLLEATVTCKQYCSKDSPINKIHASSDTKLIIGLGIGGGIFAIALFCFIKHLLQKCLNTSNIPSEDDKNRIPSTATYLPISDPIHDQCTDDGYVSLGASTGTMVTDSGSGIIRQEQEKFPMAFPELPSSAIPVSEPY